MAHNALNRHSRGDRTLTPGSDGFYTLELVSAAEAHAEDPNYLPIPNKDAYLILRMYGPGKEVRDGKYTPPTFEVQEN